VTDQQPQVADSAGIGRRLRELRIARGLLQQDLATAEISTSYVSLIEGGKRRPSPAVLAVLAERVGTSVEFLLTGRDENDLKISAWSWASPRWRCATGRPRSR